ncbi:MAG: cytochrome c [Candidatus Andeanibacterium colombiense]|uniref:Cytochrome c n=1 Tax=Candidatus Andeanibacterium colombiense TaxID=3121345 RepID=A0AAJ5X8X7_9SPHN|nr:MAG: cytochrome c [Sphingomonadaceae bacterium]
MTIARSLGGIVVLVLSACAPTAQLGSISESGLTLTSQQIAFPPDESTLPPGPGVEAANANCLACHSAGMILTQPKLSEKQWTAIVEKMRASYKAPVPDQDVPAIVAYLSSLEPG